MDIGSILIGLAALLLVAFLISQPLLDRRPAPDEALSEADRLREQRDRILVTLRDLDFDHASGKIQEEDYTALRAKLVADGAGVLKQLDELAGSPALSPATPASAGAAGSDPLEQLIAARRHAAPAASADEIERAIAARRHAPAQPTDAVERAIAARRKAAAGSAAESGGKSYCPNCGQAALAGDKFCAKCGAKLPDALSSTKDSA